MNIKKKPKTSKPRPASKKSPESYEEYLLLSDKEKMRLFKQMGKNQT
jgi:hypothetical protein